MANIRQLIDEKVDEIFLAYQNEHNIKNGDIQPLHAIDLEVTKDTLAEAIQVVCIARKNALNYDNFTPSWYIYTDCDGEAHDIVYGHNDTNQFFRDVSERICFCDCTDDTVEKIFYKGKEVEYAGCQPCMKFEYKDLDGNTVLVGYFEHWDH